MPTTRKPAAKRAPSAITEERRNARSKATAPEAPAKPARKSKPKLVAVPDDVVRPCESTLADLTAVQAQIHELSLSDRRDSADPLIARRNELILAAIKQGAGFAEIARARGVSTSTNRGLIRVLQGGKRI